MRARAGVVAIAWLAVLSGCGGDATTTTSAKPIQSVTVDLPEQLLGLRVVQEDIASHIEAVKGRTYFQSLGLFSMREGDLLRATFQVARLNSLAVEQRSDEFRRRLVALVGAAEELRMETTEIFRTIGNQQTVYMWFHGQGFLVLTVHRDLVFGRTLLRKLIEMRLQL